MKPTPSRLRSMKKRCLADKALRKTTFSIFPKPTKDQVTEPFAESHESWQISKGSGNMSIQTS